MPKKKSHPFAHLTSDALKQALSVCAEAGAELVELKIKGDVLTLTTPGDVSVRISGPLGSAAGKFPRRLVNLRKLRAWASRGPKELVTLEARPESLALSSGKRATLELVHTAQDEVLVHTAGKGAKSLALGAYSFEWPLAYCDQAASKDKSQPEFCGVAFQRERLAGSDGTRVYLATLKAPFVDGPVMPSGLVAAYLEAVDAFVDADGRRLPMEYPVLLSYGKGVFSFSLSFGGFDCLLAAPESSSKSPDYGEVIPKSATIGIEAPPAFYVAVKNGLKAQGRKDMAYLEVQPGTLRVVVRPGDDLGVTPKFSQQVSVEGAEGSMSVALDLTAVEESIDLESEDNVRLYFDPDATKSFMVRQGGSLARFAIIQPRKGAGSSNHVLPPKQVRAAQPKRALQAQVVSIAPTVSAPAQSAFDLGVTPEQVIKASLQIQQAMAGLVVRLPRRR